MGTIAELVGGYHADTTVLVKLGLDRSDWHLGEGDS